MEGDVPRLIFRNVHGLMDGRGSLMWAEDVFRALRGEEPAGAFSTLTEEALKTEIRNETGADPRLPFYWLPQGIAPTGKSEPGQTGYTWSRLSFNGPTHMPMRLGKVAWALAQSAWRYQDGLVRVLLPVDLRHHRPDQLSTANMLSMIVLDIEKDATPESITYELLRQLDEHYDSQRLLSSFRIVGEAVKLMPFKLIEFGFKVLNQTNRLLGLHLSSAMLSDLGTVDPAAFSGGGFNMDTCFFVPPEMDRLTGGFIIILECMGRYEITICMPNSLASKGRLKRLEADIEQALRPKTHHKIKISSRGVSSSTAPVSAHLDEPEINAGLPGAPPATHEHLALYDSVNATEVPFLPQLLQDLFLEHALRCPDAPAVITSGQTLTYGELLMRAKQLGEHLRARGSRPNNCIAVLMRKGWEQVVGVLAVLFSGAAYVPLDPALPRERLRYLMHDTAIEIVLTQSGVLRELDWLEDRECICLDNQELAAEDVRPIESVQQPSDLAYVIFTSGSTGSPKGVMIDHRGAVNTILDINRRFGVGPGDRVLALSNLNFDLSVYDIFGLLACGGAVVIPDDDLGKDPAHWAELLRLHGVTIWNTVPALMQLLIDYTEQDTQGIPPSLRLIMMSGDWIPVNLPARIRAQVPDARIISLGGATEASIWSISYPIGDIPPEWTSIPYGKPLANQHFYVLDAELKPCPLLVPGDLYIGGIGLALGYWRDRDKTAKSFITHPGTGERIYKTGDLGRWLPDGNIEFLGRRDFQVKIHGHRIEPGEIEAALRMHAGVREAVVIAAGDARGSAKQLVGCVAHGRADKGKPLQSDDEIKCELRDFLRDHLPEYMVPRHFIFLDRLPLNSTGKLDRKALVALAEEAAHATEYVAPRNKHEECICRLWAQVLDVERVGIHDNFFDLGGDSLKIIMLKNRLKRELARDVALTEIYEYPTVCAFSDFLKAGSAQTESHASRRAVPARTWPKNVVDMAAVIFKHIWVNRLNIFRQRRLRLEEYAFGRMAREHDGKSALETLMDKIDDEESVAIMLGQAGDPVT